MRRLERVRSGARFAVNSTSRALIRDEAVRKRIVERYYAFRSGRVNRGAPRAYRTGADLVDWRATMGFSFECSREVYRGNTFYGIGRSLRDYAGAHTSVKACVEHGVYFGNYTNPQELEGSGLPCLLTFGTSRLAHVRAVSNTPVGLIGPYIAYASDYLTDEKLRELRANLGRVMLVYPSHSVDRVRVSYEISQLLEVVERVAKERQIDTVLICLYYRDILGGAADAYESRGFTVVTAGFREDPLFLSRQRSLIRLSDFTMSNNVGTQVGYCSYLDKPHYVFPQEKQFVSASVLDDSEFANPYATQNEIERADVAAAFRRFEPMRTPEQSRVLERYWGFSKVRSRESMALLLSDMEEAYRFPPQERQARLQEISNANVGSWGEIE